MKPPSHSGLLIILKPAEFTFCQALVTSEMDYTVFIRLARKKSSCQIQTHMITTFKQLTTENTLTMTHSLDCKMTGRETI